LRDNIPPRHGEVVLVHSAARRDDQRRCGRDTSRWKERARPETLQKPIARRALSTRHGDAARRAPGRSRSCRSRLFHSSRSFYHSAALLRDAALHRSRPRPAFISRCSPACRDRCARDVLTKSSHATAAFSDYDTPIVAPSRRYRASSRFYNHAIRVLLLAGPQARRFAGALELREAFVRLIAGTGDLPDTPDGVR
jgi:hypothetical protein